MRRLLVLIFLFLITNVMAQGSFNCNTSSILKADQTLAAESFTFKFVFDAQYSNYTVSKIDNDFSTSKVYKDIVVDQTGYSDNGFYYIYFVPGLLSMANGEATTSFAVYYTEKLGDIIGVKTIDLKTTASTFHLTDLGAAKVATSAQTYQKETKVYNTRRVYSSFDSGDRKAFEEVVEPDSYTIILNYNEKGDMKIMPTATYQWETILTRISENENSVNENGEKFVAYKLMLSGVTTVMAGVYTDRLELYYLLEGDISKKYTVKTYYNI